MPDFRERRFKLPPEAFAIGPEQEPAPRDPIDEATWASIIQLPDDVSLRTSDHHGKLFSRAREAWGHWIALVLDVQSVVAAPRDDPLALACLTVTDELQASIFAALTGYYRQAIGALRSGLEATVAGLYFRTFPDPAQFALWADGHDGGRVSMGRVRRRLGERAPFRQFEPALFDEDDGWIASLYAVLSGFSHGRPFYQTKDGTRLPSSNVELWGGSNGPIYEPRSVNLWSQLYFDVALACLVLVGLGKRELVTIERPYGIGYVDYARHLLEWHFHAPPIADAVVDWLSAGSGG